MSENNDSLPKKAKGNLFTNMFKKTEGSIVDTILKQKEKQSAQEKKEQEQANKEGGKKLSFFDRLRGENGEDENYAPVILPPKHWVSALKYSIVGAVVLWGISAVVFDEQNTVLQIASIQNIGGQLQEYRTQKDEIDQEIIDLRRQISQIQANGPIEKVVQMMADIRTERVRWSDLIQKVGEVLDRVPQDYIDDLDVGGYVGDAEENMLSVITSLKNERVMTLNANIVDALDEHPDFYNVLYRKYAKSKFQDADDPSNDDFSTQAKIDFQFEQHQSAEAPQTSSAQLLTNNP